MRKLSMLAALVAALVAPSALGQNSPSTPMLQIRPGDRQTTGTVSAASTCAATGFGGGTSCVQQYASGMGTAVVTVVGAFTATLVFQVMQPDGTWTTATAVPQGGGAPVFSTVNGAGTWFINVVGYQGVRVNCTAFTSTPTISIETSMWLNLPGVSSAMAASFNGTTAQMTAPPGHWSVQVQPAANTAAVASKAAGTGTTRHVATSATVCISAVAAQADIIFNLRDGATGAGTIVWSVRLAQPTVGGSLCVTSPPLNIIGTAATAMTLESAAAPAATNFATASITGYDLL